MRTVKGKKGSFCHNRNLPLPVEETVAAIVHKMTSILPIVESTAVWVSFQSHKTSTTKGSESKGNSCLAMLIYDITKHRTVVRICHKLEQNQGKWGIRSEKLPIFWTFWLQKVPLAWNMLWIRLSIACSRQRVTDRWPLSDCLPILFSTKCQT